MPSTTRYKRGHIVLVPFPFTDLSSSKRRPTLVISPDAFNDQMQDIVVAAITSQLGPDHAITIEEGDCLDGALPKTSVVKLAKVFTIHSTLVIKKICVLQQEKLDAVLGELRRFFS
jgi:mRNA-degrading endonuclease toxin of MazEF toxin-antitoxin module